MQVSSSGSMKCSSLSVPFDCMTTGSMLPTVQKTTATLFTLPSSPCYVRRVAESRPTENTDRFSFSHSLMFSCSHVQYVCALH